jgi:hypothetical protein
MRRRRVRCSSFWFAGIDSASRVFVIDGLYAGRSTSRWREQIDGIVSAGEESGSRFRANAHISKSRYGAPASVAKLTDYACFA